MSSSGTPGFAKPPPNYETRGPNIIACCVVLLVVPSIATFIRLWSRSVASRSRFWWDDFTLLLTLLFSHLYLIISLWGVSIGLGKHSWMISLDDAKSNLIMLHLSLMFYSTAITLMKLSALALYARLFRVSTRTRWYLWVLGTFVTIFWVVIMVVPWTNCTPVAKTIDPFIPGKCTTRTDYYIAAGTLNAALDFIILLTPMPLVWKLNLRFKKKVFVSLVFLFGYW